MEPFFLSQYHTFRKNHSPKDRRAALIDLVKENEEIGNDCSRCSGECCTFTSNSMAITPVEALDLFFFLKENNLLNKALRNKLQETVKSYRLDQFIEMGKGDYVKRTYTCPFFSQRGCEIGLVDKPYGCIAFNPNQPFQEEGGDCSHSGSVSDSFSPSEKERSLNQTLVKSFAFPYPKLPIPLGLLKVWKVLPL